MNIGFLALFIGFAAFIISGFCSSGLKEKASKIDCTSINYNITDYILEL